MFDFSTIRQTALAALFSVLFTAVAVGAAVGPARSVETAPVAYAALDTADVRG